MAAATRGSVEADGESAHLRVQGERVATRRSDELQGLYLVNSGGEVTASDDEFFAALFPGEIWVLPMATPGLDELLFRAWYERLCASNLVHRAQLDDLPLAWRRRALGFLPVPSARLHCHRGAAPRWRVLELVDFASYPRPSSVEA